MPIFFHLNLFISPEIFIKTNKHEHPLKYYQYIPNPWYCEMALEDDCSRKHEKYFEYNCYSVYLCSKCFFYLCDLDAKRFEIKENSTKETKNNQM